MIRHKGLVAGSIIAFALVGCDDHTASSPTAPSISAASSTRQSVGPDLSTSSPRSGTLHLIKECPTYTGLAGSSCTITESNIREIEVGSTVVYASAATPTSLDSDLILDLPEPGNNAAFGHVILDRVAGRSDITFSGGTGKFTHFSATIVGTRLFGRTWALDGTYSFGPRDNDGGER